MIHLTKISFDEDTTDKYKGVPRVDRRVLEHGIQTLPGPVPSNEVIKVSHSAAPIMGMPGRIELEPPHPYKKSSLGNLHAYSTHNYTVASFSNESKRVLEGKFQGFRF